MPKKPFRAPAICPVCGERVPPRALACPECGADERSGWKEDALTYDGVDLPDEDQEFDYDDFVKREFGGKSHPETHAKGLWWIAGVVLLAALLWMLLLQWH